MNQILPFDAELLRRYDRPGPRYTSYPTAPQFHAGFGAPALRECARRSNADPIPRPISIYVHVPYCTSPCFYCGCNRVITRDAARGERYVERLLREIELAAPLFDRDRDVIQLHFGGGTPNFLAPAQLGQIVESLDRHFHFSRSPNRDFSIELDPRFVSPSDIKELANLGFNRASLGVQDFDPEVQKAVNRIQSVEQTLEIIEACHTSGMRSVNVDLIYGLPKQTLAGFAKTLDTVLAVRPERLAVYGYAHMPSLFKAQRQIVDTDLPSAQDKLALLQLAILRCGDAGYRYIGMDHFALPEDDLARAQESHGLHRNFMGYTTHAESDLLGLGVSAISHIGDSYSQNFRDLPSWEAALDNAHLPIWRGMQLSFDDQLRAEVIQQLMCQGELKFSHIEARFQIDFATYFSEALQAVSALEADGLVEIRSDGIAVSVRGRLLVRIIAACFDQYLTAPKGELGTSATPAPNFSKVI